MASRDAAPASSVPDGTPYKVGIVVSQWNADITSNLLHGAREILLNAGVLPDNIEELSVPGAFELPWGARQLMKADKKDAIICLGCIIRGETKHDEYIAIAVANGIMQLGLASGIPVVFGVVTTNTLQQAQERSGGKHGNKGAEAASTALQLSYIRSGGKSEKRKIGF